MTESGTGLLLGKRILVAEDNLLAADNLCALLKASGSSIVGPAERVEQAARLARWSPLDGAVIDVNLRGELSFPVAYLLRERRIPFLFILWSEIPLVIPQPLRNAPALSQPLDTELLAVAAREFSRGGGRGLFG
jgi:hypothetical protein